MSASRTVDSRWAMTSEVRPMQGGGQRLLHRGFGLRVEVGGGLVQHHHLGRLQQDAGDGQALLLAAGQPVAPVADHRVDAVGQGGDHGGDLGAGQGGIQLTLGGIGLGEEQVLAGWSRGTDGRPG